MCVCVPLCHENGFAASCSSSSSPPSPKGLLLSSGREPIDPRDVLANDALPCSALGRAVGLAASSANWLSGERADAEGECAEREPEPSLSLDCESSDAVSDRVLSMLRASVSLLYLSSSSSDPGSARKKCCSKSAVLDRSSGSRMKQHAAQCVVWECKQADSKAVSGSVEMGMTTDVTADQQRPPLSLSLRTTTHLETPSALAPASRRWAAWSPPLRCAP